MHIIMRSHSRLTLGTFKCGFGWFLRYVLGSFESFLKLLGCFAGKCTRFNGWLCLFYFIFYVLWCIQIIFRPKRDKTNVDNGLSNSIGEQNYCTIRIIRCVIWRGELFVAYFGPIFKTQLYILKNTNIIGTMKKCKNMYVPWYASCDLHAPIRVGWDETKWKGQISYIKNRK